MQKTHIVILTTAFLSGCVTYPPPGQKFVGPVASLTMTSVARGPFAENVFIVSAINGAGFDGMINPSQPPPDMPLNPTTGPLTTVTIPASQPTRFTVCGESVFQAPIFAIAMDDYQLTGDISFTPVAGQTYVVKGTFSPSYAAVWIVNAATDQLAAPKLVANGSGKVPNFEWPPKLSFGPPPPCQQ